MEVSKIVIFNPLNVIIDVELKIDQSSNNMYHLHPDQVSTTLKKAKKHLNTLWAVKLTELQNEHQDRVNMDMISVPLKTKPLNSR